VFDRKFDINDVEELSTAFNSGLSVEVGEGVPSREYADIVGKVEGLGEVIGALAGESEAARATAIEFVLEGLHLHKLLNKYSVDGRASYMG
jgi:magnesium chelatase subunit I